MCVCACVWGFSALPASPELPPPFCRHPHRALLRAALLKAEEEWIAQTCATIAAHKPDLVITEKGLSDLAAHFLTKVRAHATSHMVNAGQTPVKRLSNCQLSAGQSPVNLW